ncbi:MAG: NAD-dependent malic enzyme, partial [Coxiellaceae bacterium]|nr:NAD-dependent malic enzyme [Coxiellaceae bacterium]
IVAHLTEMMPIIYTPVVGEACQRFSNIYRRPRGLFIAYPHKDRIAAMLENTPVPDVKVIVVTDGERILGLGDQGVGGMGIPIGKLSLYTACGGINPANTLPITLDVGTNNEALRNDPTYLGWRHERITGDEYYDFVEAFVKAVKKKFPKVLLQFEDFAQPHANPLLQKYRDQLCTFNDDIQGTASIAVSAIIAAVKASGMPLSEHRVAVLGAGSAGCGISEYLVQLMIDDGISEDDARSRFYMIDRQGLLLDNMEGLMPFQQKLTQPCDKTSSFSSGDKIELIDVIEHAKPTILIGVSGQPNQFTEAMVQKMLTYTKRPIIFPMSNPISRCEAQPEDLLKWSNGQALVATGSPFPPVKLNGKTYEIAQSNNCYIFPGMGLGILACGAKRVSDAMFMQAARALAETAPALHTEGGALLPPLSDVRDVSKKIAFAVAKQAMEDGFASSISDEKLQQLIDETLWEPRY